MALVAVSIDEEGCVVDCSACVDRLGEEARRDLIAQAKVLQMSLQAIVDRVEEVKSEHEKLEGGNKFLQS